MKRIRWIAALLALFVPLSLTACTPAAPVEQPESEPTPATPTSTAVPEPPDFRIIGYFYGMDGVLDPAVLQYLTHINYAFALPNADGTLQTLANGWKLSALVEQAHASGVQVLISVGGWGWDEQFEALAAAPESRAVFAQAVADLVAEYDLDGADIDWEYPGPGYVSSQNFTLLIQAVRDALPQDKLLTAAVAAYGEGADGNGDEALALFDFVNVMAYDAPPAEHATLQFSADALAYWRERGLPAQRLTLGVPFYSRPGEAPWREILPAAGGQTDLLDQDHLNINGQEEYFNGITTLQQKTDLAKEQAGGIMIWELTHDVQGDMSLLKTIFDQSKTGE